MTTDERRKLHEELLDVRRRLGPFTALQRDDPWRICDAEIARCLVRVIEVLDKVLNDGGRL